MGVLVLKICALTFLSHDPLIIRVGSIIRAVKVILDKRLYDAPFVSFHPMDNSASIAINREGIEKLKTLCGRDNKEFEILDFSTIATEEGN